MKAYKIATAAPAAYETLIDGTKQELVGWFRQQLREAAQSPDPEWEAAASLKSHRKDMEALSRIQWALRAAIERPTE